MKKILILLTTVVIFLSACAPVANYKPYGSGSALTGEAAMGYKETQIESGKWFVQYIASTSQSETDMVRFAVRRANEVGGAQCHGSYRKSSPTINSDVTQVAGMLITRKTVNLTVTCQ